MLLRSFQHCTGRCSQHLGVKVKYFREQIFQVLRVLGVFRAYVLSNSGTSCTRRIMMYCRILYSKYFGLMYCGILPVSQYFEVQYSGYFRTRSSVSAFDTMETAVLQAFRALYCGYCCTYWPHFVHWFCEFSEYCTLNMRSVLGV